MSSDTQHDDFDSGPPFQDRSAGLTVFGIILALMGTGCALLVPLMFVAAKMNPMGGMRSMIPAVGFYGLLAVVFFSLGAGSITCRRWARALTLVLAWISLVMGVFSLIMVVSMLPAMFNFPDQGQKIPREAISFIRVMTVGVLGVVYILVPGIFVYFYQSKDVKLTCEFHDPHVRWTDKCPLPVLALCMVPAFGAFSMLMTLGYGPVLPFFGVLLKGWPAVLGILGVSLIFVALVWGTYKLKMGAWWGSLLMYLGCGLSYAITFARIEMIDFYRAMDFTEEQLEMMQNSGMLEQMNIPLMTGLWVFGIVIYLLWVRRYFVNADAVAESTDHTDQSTAA